MTPAAMHEMVDAYRSETLSTVLGLAGVTTIPKTKEGKVALWLLLVSDRKRIERSLELLTLRCRKALELLQIAGGELRTARYESLLMRAGLTEKQSKQKKPMRHWATTAPDMADDPVTFQEVLAALVKWGLVWTHTSPAGPSYKLSFETPGRYVVVPPGVAVHLPSPPRPAQSVRDVPHILSGSARTCQRDLYLLWSTVREMPLQTIGSGQLRMSDLKRLSSQLLVQETIATGSKEADYRRLFFLRRLAEALGLVKWKTERGVNRLTAQADPAFFLVDPAQRVHESFTAWRTGAWWNELWATYVPGATRASGTVVDLALPKVVEARQVVLDEITRRAKAGEEWIWLDAIGVRLSMRNESFLVDRSIADSQRQGPYGYVYTAISPYGYNSLNWTWDAYQQDEDKGWRGVEEVFIRSVVAEGLFWLGLVDLGYLQPAASSGGAAPPATAALRLTEMGRWLLIDGPQPALPEEAGRVVVQPNFRIFAFDPIADRILARLDTFAARLNAERAIEYEINRDTIYRALIAGETVDAVKGWLLEVSGSPLPQNVERSLDEWQTAYDRIVFRPQVAVVLGAPEQLDALLAIPTLKSAALKRLDATRVLVDARHVDAVERALLEMDELPDRISGEASLAGCLSVDDAGVVSFAHGLPNLYALGRLRAFADETDTGWRISSDSVRRGQAAGLDAQAILDRLSQLEGADPSPALAVLIKAWCRHYGDVTIQSVTLVEFRDQATLDEILLDPQLKRLLRNFRPGAGLGLASVDPKDLDTAIDLLRERGIAVRKG